MSGGVSFKTIDLRSDTVTKPTKEMRTAMAEAEVGDDMYGEDPTVNKLQDIAAEMFGKEASLFVPTGTMGNLISIMSHCWSRGSEVILGDQSHIYIYEQGGIAQLGSIVPRAIPNLPDGTFKLCDVERVYRTDDNPHFAKSTVVAVENAMFGKVLPLSFLSEVRSLADKLNLVVHLDGARVFNAATALDINVKEILKYVDSASICLSKGLCSPVGSIIVGDRAFIARAHRLRKVLGGAMRQCGILAAAAIISLTEMTKRLHIDHKNARTFAEALLTVDPKLFALNLSNVQTNMAVFEVSPEFKFEDDVGVTPAEKFCKEMETCTSDSPICVKLLAFSKSVVRAVFHCDISEDDTKLAIRKLNFVVETWKKCSKISK